MVSGRGKAGPRAPETDPVQEAAGHIVYSHVTADQDRMNRCKE
jgi:hypothetical protein